MEKKAFEYFIQLANEYITEYHKKYEITKEGLQLLTTRKRIGSTWNYETVNKYTDIEIEEILNSDLSIWEKEKLQNAIKNNYWKMFLKLHFDSDIAVIEKIVESHDTINETMLNKILDYQVKEKKEMFIARIKEVIGEIKDLNGLHIGDNGEINGIAKGVKANAKVNTITAGGYNIQCYHFRVLVNTIK